MIVAGDWLTDAGPVLRGLNAAGYQAFAVGGAVRNAALGLPVSDVDVATDATPAQVVAVADAMGLRVIPTGIAHGTVTVLAKIALEVTTFRRDVKTDGRHATVAFSSDIHQDAARRDFTMNALYADASGQVIDPLGGMADLLARRLRFVGDPNHRIAEDYLRILRYFRFFAIHADPAQGFDADTLAAIADHLAGLETLSRERIGAEMRKLLAADDPAPSVNTMAQTGVLQRILPGADPQFLAPLVHIAAETAPSWLARLAVMGGADVQAALRLSKSEMDSYQTLRAEMGTGTRPAALGWQFGSSLAVDIVHARAAMLSTSLPPDWRADIERGAEAVFPIQAADLMPALSGPALGQKLRALQTLWLQSDLTLTRAQLLS